MSLSDKVLEELKVTRQDFEDFIHTRNQAGVFGKAAQRVYRSGFVFKTPTCCGMVELGALELVGYQTQLAAVLYAIVSQLYRGLIYYAAREEDAKNFLAMGFHDAGQFVNPNTGRTITILTMTLKK